MGDVAENGKRAALRDGTETKALFIKHLAISDWEALKRIMVQLGGKSVADAVRYAIRKAAGVL